MGASIEFKNQLSYYSSAITSSISTPMTFGSISTIDVGTPVLASIPNNNNIVFNNQGKFDVRQVGYYKVYANFLFNGSSLLQEEYSIELYINEEKAHGGKSAVGFEMKGGKGASVLFPVVASWIVYCGYNDNNNSNSGLASSINTLTFRANGLSNPTTDLLLESFNTTIIKID